MATVNINEFKPENIDLKIEKRIPFTCKQFDNIILSLNVFDYSVPVDLTNYFVELKIQQPNGQKFTQSAGIIKTGNNIKITCANEVSNVYGKTKIELDFTDSSNLKKSSFVIVVNVKESIGGSAEGGSATPGNGVPVALAIPLSELEAYVAQATVLNGTFATNTATQATTQASLDASVTSAHNIANSVASSLSTANNLNANVDTARALNDALVADIAIGNPLKTGLETINTTASTTSTALQAKIDTADKKIAEFKSFDTSGLITKVDGLQASVNAEGTNITNIQNEIATARNGKTNLKDGIVDLIKTNAPVSSVVNDTNFTTLKNDVEAARLGEVSLTLGIRDAINNVVDPLKTQVNNISLSGADTALRSEVSDARFGKSTLSLGIQKAISDVKAALELEIDSRVGTGVDTALTNEVIDARNGELTLKAGMHTMVNTSASNLQSQINAITGNVKDTELRAEVKDATVGYNDLKAKLDAVVTNASSATQTVANDVATINSSLTSVKNGASTVKIGIQTMIDTALDNWEIPAEAITMEMVDDININIMTSMVAIEKGTQKRFNTLSDNMRVETFTDNDNYLTIQCGVYDKDNKQIKSKNVTLDYLAFCFD